MYDNPIKFRLQSSFFPAKKSLKIENKDRKQNGIK